MRVTQVGVTIVYTLMAIIPATIVLLTSMVMYDSLNEQFERVSRRIIMPIVTRIATIMHGGWEVDGTVWASGIKDVAWLSYESGRSVPEKMRVEKCISDDVK